MKAAFHTFGCKLNQVETEAIAKGFAAEGWGISDNGEADLFFVNTCAVTAKAEGKSRRLIRKLAAKSPGKVIAAGCLAQLKPEETAALGDLKLVLGTADKFEALALVRESGLVKVTPWSGAELEPCIGRRFRSRVFVKIQDGCDHGCSYCVVPKLRGGSISVDSEKVIEAVKSQLAGAKNEIVLTGVDIGSYRDRKGVDLAELLGRLETVPDLVRIRLSSLEPPGVTDKLIEVVSNSDKICPHFHIPMQSGCDGILKRMNRSYSASQYAELMHKLISKFPSARIGTDVIVGFPGESNADFAETAELVEISPLTHIHIFPFSARPGTEFNLKDDTVPPVVKTERAETLRQIIRRKNRAFLEQRMGKVAEVLLEGDGDRGGLTGDYIRVFPRISQEAGFVKLRLSRILKEGMEGEPMDNSG